MGWHTSARESHSINTVRVGELCEIIDHEKKDYFILDVRAESEVEGTGEIRDAINIHLTQLEENLSRLPKDKQIYIFCGTGIRAMTAASLLKREGFDNINVVLGGLKGWNSATCPID